MMAHLEAMPVMVAAKMEMVVLMAEAAAAG